MRACARDLLRLASRNPEAEGKGAARLLEACLVTITPLWPQDGRTLTLHASDSSLIVPFPFPLRPPCALSCGFMIVPARESVEAAGEGCPREWLRGKMFMSPNRGRKNGVFAPSRWTTILHPWIAPSLSLSPSFPLPHDFFPSLFPSLPTLLPSYPFLALVVLRRLGKAFRNLSK